MTRVTSLSPLLIVGIILFSGESAKGRDTYTKIIRAGARLKPFKLPPPPEIAGVLNGRTRTFADRIVGVKIEPADAGLECRVGGSSWQLTAAPEAAGRIFKLTVTKSFVTQSWRVLDIKRNRGRWIDGGRQEKAEEYTVLAKISNLPPRTLAPKRMNPGGKARMRLPGDAEIVKIIRGTSSNAEASLDPENRLNIVAKRVGKASIRLEYRLGRVKFPTDVEVHVVSEPVPPDPPDPPDPPAPPKPDTPEQASPEQVRETVTADASSGPVDPSPKRRASPRKRRASPPERCDSFKITRVKDVDDLRITVEVIPDAFLYEMVRGYEDLVSSGHRGQLLEDEFRKLYYHHRKNKDKMLVSVELTDRQFDDDLPEEKRSKVAATRYYLLPKRAEFLSLRRGRHRMLHRIRKTNDSYERWQVFSPGRDSTEWFCLIKSLRIELHPVKHTRRDPFTVSVQGILAQKRSASRQNSISINPRQLSCRSLAELVIPRIALTLYPARWKPPKPPKGFDRLLKRMWAKKH